MKKDKAVLRAIAASHFEIAHNGQIDKPKLYLLGAPDAGMAAIIANAERLFDYALKYRYGPEILYRQSAEWYGFPAQDWNDLPEPLRVGFTLFHAATNVLAPFIEAPAPAEPERQAETRTHGFEHGFGDEDGGKRALKIGEERLPVSGNASNQADGSPAPQGGEIDIEAIAQAAHRANRQYCFFLGDNSQVPWDEAPQWQRDSAVNGVRYAIDNDYPAPELMHENWMKVKLAEGWVYGEIKDPEKKQHPCIVPYEQLPEAQRIKDELFRYVVRTCAGAEDHGSEIDRILCEAEAAALKGSSGAGQVPATDSQAQGAPSSPAAVLTEATEGATSEQPAAEQAEKAGKGKRRK